MAELNIDGLGGEERVVHLNYINETVCKPR